MNWFYIPPALFHPLITQYPLRSEDRSEMKVPLTQWARFQPWPDKHEDLIGWNRRWEEVLDFVYSSDNPSIPAQRTRLGKATRAVLLIQAGELCSFQRDLNHSAVAAFSCLNLESLWRTYSQEKREELVLEGLHAASCICEGGVEQERILSPEMSIKHLAGVDSGADFISVLKRFMLADRLSSNLVEPIMLDNEAANNIIDASTQDSKLVKLGHFSRCFFMTMALRGTLNAVKGRLRGSSHNRLPVESMKTKEWKEHIRQIKSDLPQNIVQEITGRQLPPAICHTCKKGRKSVGHDLKLCGRCRAVDQSVWYCSRFVLSNDVTAHVRCSLQSASRGCQETDWTSGLPVPHRVACGKPKTEERQLQHTSHSASSEASGSKRLLIEWTDAAEQEKRMIPPPDQSFKRPPALLYQIKLLTTQAAKHYYFINTPPNLDFGTNFFGEAAPAFVAHRNRAMQKGCKDAVEAMYRIVQVGIQDDRVPIGNDRLRTQLEQEYGVKLEDCVLAEPCPLADNLTLRKVEILGKDVTEGSGA